MDAPRSIGASGSGLSHCSAGSTNSFPRPGVAPSATRRFVSTGRARTAARVRAERFHVHAPPSPLGERRSDRIQYGITGTDVHPEAPIVRMFVPRSPSVRSSEPA